MPVRSPMLIAVAAVMVVLVVSGCASVVPSPSMPSAMPAPSSDPIAPAPGSPVAASPLPTSTPASSAPTPTSGALTTQDIDPRNLTPWPVSSISAGGSICAVGNDKRLRCWASSEGGQAPDGKFKAVAAGEETSCAIRTDDTVVCWGWEPPAPKGRFTALSVTPGAVCGIRTSGKLHCSWTRQNDVGDRIADGSGAPEVPAGRYTAVSLAPDGEGDGCALRDDGFVACWWAPWMEDLEDLEDLPGMHPSPSTRYRSLGDRCAVTVAGEIECFGSAAWYGDGPNPDLPTGPFVAMDGERYRGCAIRDNGSLACWGRGGWDDEGNDLAMPTPSGSFKAVSVGDSYACALQTDDHAVCWGDNMAAARPAPMAIMKVPRFVLDTRVPVAWRAITVGAPVVAYDVEYTSGPWTETEDGDFATTWTRLLTGTRKTRTTLTGEDGKEYWWRVRAHDADGLVSDWSEAYGTVVPVDDRALQATGTWTTVRDDAYFHGSAMRTTTKGATLLISETGAYGLVIVATTCPGCGTVQLQYPSEECSPDEEAATPQASCPPEREEITLRGTRRASTVVYMGNNGQDGYEGPLELVVTSSGKPVTIDAVVFADTE